MLLKLLEKIGGGFMWLCGVKEVPPVLPEEHTMQASAGRSFINYDQYDPDQLLRMSSENYEDN